VILVSVFRLSRRPPTRSRSCWPSTTPAEHWVHLCTSDPIESTFATVRHGPRSPKGSAGWPWRTAHRVSPGPLAMRERAPSGPARPRWGDVRGRRHRHRVHRQVPDPHRRVARRRRGRHAQQDRLCTGVDNARLDRTSSNTASTDTSPPNSVASARSPLSTMDVVAGTAQRQGQCLRDRGIVLNEQQPRHNPLAFR
jgi:hypothetical protein